MCGIAGIVDIKGTNYKEVVGKMTNKLKHRGPDAERVFSFGECTLGHARLSIIDLSTGDQPMVTKDGKLGIVFNGEIYGYKELRNSLQYDFLTQSDTEVILALYKEHGKESFLSRLPGMFAFALWDDEKKNLFCVRDRFGEKPFYYAFGKKGEFIFASEIKSILSSGLVYPVLDKESVTHYLKHLYVHPEKTIYKNIYTLPPAHFLELRDGKIFTSRYWDMPKVQSRIELPDAISELEKLLNDAVKKQLIADVPVGAFLSGGLDSSTIVALASKYNPRIKTFSFGFRDSIDETHFAREISKKYNTDHVELFDDQEDLGELLIKMQEIYDEPFGDSSNIPTYLISKLSKKYTTVALTGDGGDEFFGGYGWYHPYLFLNKKISGIFHTRAAYVMGKILRRIGDNRLHNKILGTKMSSFSSIVEAHTRGREVVFSDEYINKLGLPEINEYRLFRPSWNETNTIDDTFRVDVENYMPGDILVKIDRASMANSLELRAPFLDISLASFCLSLPYSLKINNNIDKYILRKTYSYMWTEDVRRRKKQGFGAPVGKWLNEESIRNLMKDYIFDKKKKIHSLISSEEILRIGMKYNYQTWALLVLSLWMEHHDFDM